MSRNTFSLLSEREQAARLTAKHTLGEHMSSILLGICLILTAVLPLVVLRLVNPFSEGFLIRTSYTVLTSTLTYLLFKERNYATVTSENVTESYCGIDRFSTILLL